MIDLSFISSGATVFFRQESRDLYLMQTVSILEESSTISTCIYIINTLHQRNCGTKRNEFLAFASIAEKYLTVCICDYLIYYVKVKQEMSHGGVCHSSSVLSTRPYHE